MWKFFIQLKKKKQIEQINHSISIPILSLNSTFCVSSPTKKKQSIKNMKKNLRNELFRNNVSDNEQKKITKLCQSWNIFKYHTPQQSKKDRCAQKWDYSYWKVLKIPRILMYILTPENSGSTEIFISSFHHFESKFGCYFAKVPWNFAMRLGTQPKEQISTLTFEIWFVFVGKIMQNILSQEKNWPFWRKNLWSHQNYQAVRKRTRKKPI